MHAALCLEGQTPRVESLKRRVELAENRTQKLDAITALLRQSYSLERDTVFYYASEAKRLAMELHDPIGLARAEYFIIIALRRNGFEDSCLRLCNQYLQHLIYSEDPKIYTWFKLLQLDIIANTAGSKDGINYALEFLKQVESNDDTLAQVLVKSRIGSMYSDIGQYENGLKWLYIADETSSNKDYDYQKNNSVLFFNIGLDYNYL
jgi:hypothetical protein